MGCARITLDYPIVGTFWNVLEAQPSLARNLSVQTWTSKAGTATKALAQIGSWLQGLEPQMQWYRAYTSGIISKLYWNVLLCLSKVVTKRSLRKSRSSKHSRGSISHGLCGSHRILQFTCTVRQCSWGEGFSSASIWHRCIAPRRMSCGQEA